MRILLNGCTGRMGRALFAIIASRDDCALVAALEAPGTSAIGADIGQLLRAEPSGIIISDDPLTALAACKPDAIIDFSTPAASVVLARLAAQARIIDVIGTTGLDEDAQAEIDAAARHAIIIQDSNMSFGIALMSYAVGQLARGLTDWDVEILDIHHRNKVDVPSGTTQKLHAVIAQARGDGVALKSRKSGIIGARPSGDVFFASLRGGSVIGDHEIMFLNDHEQIRITHRAENRDVFAYGAVRAASLAHVIQLPPGRYKMADMIAQMHNAPPSSDVENKRNKSDSKNKSGAKK